MNVVIYARFSSHSQTEQSIEGQLKVCYEYAESNHYVCIVFNGDVLCRGQEMGRKFIQCAVGLEGCTDHVNHGHDGHGTAQQQEDV